MRVATLESSVENRLNQVETLLEQLALKISGNHLCVEDTLAKRTYIVMDIELTNSYCNQLPRGIESDRLVLNE